MAHVETWDETKPAGSRDANLGDDDIREFKRALTERLRAGGMYFPTTDNADAGLYNYIQMIEQSSNPTSAANRGFLFTKDVSGVTELYWMDSAGTAIQLTSGGKVLISSLVIASEARGDLIARGASAWARKALGAVRTFLRSDGTDPQWSAIQDGDIESTALPDGSVVQVQQAQDSSVDSSTTAIPLDDTVPQNTEGEEYTQLAVTITPKHASNVLLIELELWLEHSSGVPGHNIAAIFQDSTAGALAAGYMKSNTSFGAESIRISFKMTAGTTSATTFKVRYGPASASGTCYTNANTSGTRFFGGVMYSSLKVTEVKV